MPRIHDLATLRRTTRRDVRVAGVSITLMRPPPSQDDGHGGTRRARGAPTPLRPQRFVLAGVTADTSEHRADEGERRVARFVLVSDNVRADVQEGDTFTFEGRHYEVKSIDDDRTYQTKCEVESISG